MSEKARNFCIDYANMKELDNTAAELISFAKTNDLANFNKKVGFEFSFFLKQLRKDIYQKLKRTKYHYIFTYYSTEDALQEVNAELHKHLRNFHLSRVDRKRLYKVLTLYLFRVGKNYWFANNRIKFKVVRLELKHIEQIPEKTEKHKELFEELKELACR